MIKRYKILLNTTHSLEKSSTHNKIMESIQRNIINGKSYRDAVKLDYFTITARMRYNDERNRSDTGILEFFRNKNSEENPDTANSQFKTNSLNMDYLAKMMKDYAKEK